MRGAGADAGRTTLRPGYLSARNTPVRANWTAGESMNASVKVSLFTLVIAAAFAPVNAMPPRFPKVIAGSAITHCRSPRDLNTNPQPRDRFREHQQHAGARLRVQVDAAPITRMGARGGEAVSEQHRYGSDQHFLRWRPVPATSASSSARPPRRRWSSGAGCVRSRTTVLRASAKQSSAELHPAQERRGLRHLRDL